MNKKFKSYHIYVDDRVPENSIDVLSVDTVQAITTVQFNTFKQGDVVICKHNCGDKNVKKGLRYIIDTGPNIANCYTLTTVSGWHHVSRFSLDIAAVFKVGDIVECIDNTLGYKRYLTIGKAYVVTSVCSREIYFIDDTGRESSASPARFEISVASSTCPSDCGEDECPPTCDKLIEKSEEVEPKCYCNNIDFMHNKDCKYVLWNRKRFNRRLD